MERAAQTRGGEKMKKETKEADIKRRRSDKSEREGSVTETPVTCSQV